MRHFPVTRKRFASYACKILETVRGFQMSCVSKKLSLRQMNFSMPDVLVRRNAQDVHLPMRRQIGRSDAQKQQLLGSICSKDKFDAQKDGILAGFAPPAKTDAQVRARHAKINESGRGQCAALRLYLGFLRQAPRRFEKHACRDTANGRQPTLFSLARAFSSFS